LRIVFLGTPDFAVASLRRIVEAGYRVVAAVTMPDKPAGRGLKLQESAVKQYATAAGIPVLQPEKLRDPAFLETLRALEPDLGVVIAFRMLPEAIWSLPRLGTFNLHASLLPQYRGAAPINRAVMDGQTATGVTTFLLNAEIDKGDIVMREPVAIGPDEDAGSLHDRLMAVGAGLVIETIERLATGNYTPEVQLHIPESQLRTAPKIFKVDARIDWNQSGETIRNLIRGLSPCPGAWCTMRQGAETIVVKIYTASFEPAAHSLVPGTIVADRKKMLTAACADGFLNITELHVAGKRRMATHELLPGFRDMEEYVFT
jgi:methionyl-tRNA formyltransferase